MTAPSQNQPLPDLEGTGICLTTKAVTERREKIVKAPAQKCDVAAWQVRPGSR